MKTADHTTIGWLYDVAHSLDWQVSILDILETERRYPGLMYDLGTEAWQRKLVKEQMTGKNDSEVDGIE